MEIPPPNSASAPASGATWEGLKPRLFSALVLIALFLTAEITGGFVFSALVMMAGFLLLREWDDLIEQADFKDLPLFRYGGLAYIAIACLCLIWLRDVTTELSPNAGMGMVLYLVFVVAATDIGAYFTGKSLGGPKLAPRISPNKTWAGLAGGVAAAGVIGMLCAIFTEFPITVKGCIFTAMLLALVAQAGDLFESWLKRKAGVKNSGTLIPGHGGLFDRVDGLLPAAVVYALLATWGL